MSKDRNDPDAGSANAGVGYGKPPVQHRFQKGKSGNPKGRPKRKRLRTVDPLIGLNKQAMEDVILADAYRMVPVREGDKMIQMPAFQCAHRTLEQRGLKGDTRALIKWADIVQQIDAKREELYRNYVTDLIEHKKHWTPKFQQCALAGYRPPDILPHPDDIIVNLRTGIAHVAGPTSAAEKAKWDRYLAVRDDVAVDFAECLILYNNARNGKDKESWRGTVLLFQLDFDRLNDQLPRRYQTKLADRLYGSDASRPGSHKRIDWRDG